MVDRTYDDEDDGFEAEAQGSGTSDSIMSEFDEERRLLDWFDDHKEVVKEICKEIIQFNRLWGLEWFRISKIKQKLIEFHDLSSLTKLIDLFSKT